MTEKKESKTLDLGAIDKRCNAATPGPWDFDDEFMNEPGHFTLYPERDSEHEIASVNGYINGTSDAEFLARSRTDVPLMVVRIRELERQMGTWRVMAEALNRRLPEPLTGEAWADFIVRAKAKYSS